MSWTTPRTWVAGELVTAGMMNTHVRDNLNALRSEHFGVQRFRGLHLRTSPNLDVSARQVDLLHADEIVLDDGTRLGPWDNLNADIQGSVGAGALDIGTEQSSTWYSIYAIAKDDGTKNLLLHREKNYSYDTSFGTARDATRALRVATSTAADKLAQGVQFANAGPLVYVDLDVARAGAVVGRVWISIQASVSGDASGTALATSDKLDASVISTTAGYLRFVFRAPFTVVASTQYHLVLEGDYTRSDTVFVTWGGVGAGGYANGVARQYNGTTWSNTTSIGDFRFFAAIERNAAALTLPTGYTKSALLGFVFNNSSSNFSPFLAYDNRVRTLVPQASGTFTSSTMFLADLTAFFPPRPVRVHVGVGNSAVGEQVAISGVPDGYQISSGNGEGGLTSGGVHIASSSVMTSQAGHFMTEVQGVYYRTSGNTAQAWVLGYEW
jgi:hypothetical protein